ncbi:MAG: HAMP domain-containing histidine kinase [Epsilonproteobacteria bacterium]|nr:HAMP domain-containing histidine kinase [Campylobacterota bacterium]
MLSIKDVYVRNFILSFIVLLLVVIIEVFCIADKRLLVASILVSFIIVGGIFYFLMMHLIDDIAQEISTIALFLKNLIKKNKSTHLSSTSREFADITKMLLKVSHLLDKRANQHLIYTKKLETLNTQKDEIISAISHEFKNPITIINGYTQTLLDDDLPRTLQVKFLTKIYKNATKLTQLIDTLRLAIKLDNNTQKLSFTSVDVYNITKEVIDELKESYDRDIKLFGSSVLIQADSILLAVAIRNLIENAIKYSEDEVVVIVTNAYINIIDRGIGIHPNELDNIFKKFYRIGNTWNNSLGLGLSIVNNILKLHNFDIQITSQKNKGSEFKIVF